MGVKTEEPAIRHIPATLDQIAAQIMGVQGETHSIVSLFSGCGGMDLGFLGGFEFGNRYYDRLPFKLVWANDLNTAACETYKHNLKHEIVEGDIAEVMDELPKAADVVIGGFPCQDVSINGSKLGMDGDRTILYQKMIEVIKAVEPKIFIAENVKGLQQEHGKSFFDRIVSDFKETGYKVSHSLYLASDYGVPQNRERVFIVGLQDRRRKFSHPKAVKRVVTAQEAIGDLEAVQEMPEINHVWSKAARSPDQGNRRLKADKPATTIRAEHHGNIQWHYSLPRRISLREAARLQSFPDEFEFLSGMRETERQIGNAVPPVLAWHIGKAVREYLDTGRVRGVTGQSS